MLRAVGKSRAVGCCVPGVLRGTDFELELKLAPVFVFPAVGWLVRCVQLAGVTHRIRLLCSWVLRGTDFELEFKLAPVLVSASIVS